MAILSAGPCGLFQGLSNFRPFMCPDSVRRPNLAASLSAGHVTLLERHNGLVHAAAYALPEDSPETLTLAPLAPPALLELRQAVAAPDPAGSVFGAEGGGAILEGPGTKKPSETLAEAEEEAFGLALGRQGPWRSDVVRLVYSSLVTPPSTYDVDVRTGGRSSGCSPARMSGSWPCACQGPGPAGVRNLALRVSSNLALLACQGPGPAGVNNLALHGRSLHRLVHARDKVDDVGPLVCWCHAPALGAQSTDIVDRRPATARQPLLQSLQLASDLTEPLDWPHAECALCKMPGLQTLILHHCLCCWPEAKALKKRYAIGNYTRALYRSSRIWAPAEPGSGDVQARVQGLSSGVFLCAHVQPAQACKLADS